VLFSVVLSLLRRSTSDSRSATRPRVDWPSAGAGERDGAPVASGAVTTRVVTTGENLGRRELVALLGMVPIQSEYCDKARLVLVELRSATGD
jgi:hypothetical protein